MAWEFPANTERGIGITAMQERARELGGAVHIPSNHAGTLVFATLPLPSESTNGETA